MDKNRIRLEGLFIGSVLLISGGLFVWGWYKLIGYILSFFIK